MSDTVATKIDVDAIVERIEKKLFRNMASAITISTVSLVVSVVSLLIVIGKL
jgi:hypothetical protein